MKKIIINIGRQFGSGGKAVADKIGEILGIPVYDNELLTKAAQDFGFTEELFRNRDEKKRSLTLSSIFSSSIFGGGSYLTDDSALFKMQAQTIRNIAEKGSAVIVGRAADYILRDMDCCLDVFLTSFSPCGKGCGKNGDAGRKGRGIHREEREGAGKLLQLLHFRQLGRGLDL